MYEVDDDGRCVECGTSIAKGVVVTDAELIAECLRRQQVHGRLLLDREVFIGGVGCHAGAYSLSYLGPVAK